MRKIKKTIAFFLSTILLTSTLVVPVGAVETNNVETNPTTVATKPVVEKTTKNVVDNKAKTKNKKVEKATEPTTEATTKTSKKNKLKTSAKVEKVKTGVAERLDHKYDVEDVYDSSGSKMDGFEASYYVFDNSDAKKSEKNKYNYIKSGKYKPKFSRIVIEDKKGATKVEWTCDTSKLKDRGNSDSVNEDIGDVVVSRESGSNDGMKEFYYGTKKNTQTKQNEEKVWAPWNAVRKKYNSSEYTSALSHKIINSVKIDGKVTSVSKNAFRGFCADNESSHYKLILGDSVSTINENAFRNSGIKSGSNAISFSRKVTIKPVAFFSLPYVTNINFGKYNHSISDASLKSSTSSNKNLFSDYNYGCFANCEKLKTVDFGNVSTIPIKCFTSCPLLNDITWGNVEVIKMYAFSLTGGGSDGKGITLKINGTKFSQSTTASALRTYSFRDCKYKEIIFNGNCNLLRTGPAAFCFSENLKRVEIGSSTTIKTISENCFYSCRNLKTFDCKSNLTNINANAFRYCTSLLNGSPRSYGGMANVDGFDELQDGSKDHLHVQNNADDYNVFELPKTVTFIGESAFRKCTSLRAVTFEDIGNVKLTTIKHNTFLNDYNLEYFGLPNSVETIEGTRNDNDSKNATDNVSDTDNNTDIANQNIEDEKKFGAFVIDETTANTKVSYSFWLGISNNNQSKLTTIGDKAFLRGKIITDSNGNEKGMAFYDRTTGRKVGEASDKTNLLVFPKLQYIGNRAFMNNRTLTGCLLAEQYITIGSRAFVNTNLTDFYFKWDSKSEKTDNNYATKVLSSVIGSSNSFINSLARGYSREAWSDVLKNNGYSETYNNYTSLWRIINESDTGLIALWATYFTNLNYLNSNYNSWTANLGNTAVTPNATVPKRTTGVKNDDGTTYTKDTKSITTKSYLKTEAEWVSKEKTARETVTFGYKNNHNYDIIFVVDNSPSMDRAAKEDKSGGYTLDSNTPYAGVNNASKMMNAYAQIYDLSEQMLKNQNNTVSVISFRGTNDNSLAASSKFITNKTSINTNNLADDVPMTSATDVKTALFANDNGYDDNNDGYTNYSSGLSRAYQLISSMQNRPDTDSKKKNEQIVILVTDGHPTFYNGNQAVSAIDSNANGYIGAAASQVNGTDWATAIRGTGSYSVHDYNLSKYDFSEQTHEIKMTTVKGLNTKIYGILIGTQPDSVVTAMQNNITDGTGDKVFTAESMDKVATSLNALFNELTCESYTIVVPFDKNFELAASLRHSIEGNVDGFSSYKMKITKKVGSTTTTLNEFGYYDQGRDAILLPASKAKDNALVIKYSQGNNALIIRMLDTNSYPSAKNTSKEFMNPYVTYTFENIPLKYNGNGGHYTYTSGSTKTDYVTVSDNDPTYSKSYITSPDNTYINMLQTYDENTRPKGLGLNGSVSGGNQLNYDKGNYVNRTSGAFVILNNKDNTRQITNFADALWLPIEKGTVKIYKYKSTMSNGTETASTTKLSGAKFQLYDQNGNIVNLKADSATTAIAKYSYEPEGTITDFTSVSNYIEISGLPYGKYYLYETQTPAQVGTYKYVESSANIGAPKEAVVLNIPNSTDSSKPITTSTFSLSTTSAEVSIYNREVDVGYSRIVGTKKAITVDKNGDKQIIPLKGAVIGMFPTENDAKNETNMITKATSGSDGTYTISVKDIQNQIGINRSYYFKEITAPSGYQKVDVVKSVGIYSLTGDYTWTVPTIYNVELGTIRVWVDSSDNIQNDFNIKLTGTYTSNNGNTVTKTYTSTTQNTDTDYYKANGWLPANGYCDFKVPLFYATGTNNNQTYVPITYKIEETGYKGSAIPDRYMCQLYADLSNITSSENLPAGEVFESQPFEQFKQPITFNSNYTLSGGTESDISGWQLSTNYKASIYNLSVRVKVNATAADTGRFLNSTFKTINNHKYSDTKVPTTTATFSPYNSIASTGSITEWSVGNLNENDNGSEYQNGSYQWRTGFIDTEGAEMLKLNIEGDKYKYEIFCYDENKEFLYVDRYRDDDGSVIYASTTQKLDYGVAYVRIVQFKRDTTSTNYPFSIDIEKQKGSWVYFDNWFGTTNFQIEQTSVEKGYYLTADNVSSESTLRDNSKVAMYTYNIKTNESTGKKYLETYASFRNVRMANFVKVGSNGFVHYIYIGVGFVVASLVPLLFNKKKKRKLPVSKFV